MARRIVPSVLTAMVLLVGALSVGASNLNTHAGGAAAVNPDAWFVAGSILADLNHYLPTSYETDTIEIANRMLARATTTRQRQFALGWYEHVDQDQGFAAAVAAAQANHRKVRWVLQTRWVGSWIPYPVFTWVPVDDGPKYSVSDIRLVFDYLTILNHRTGINPLFIASDDSIVNLIVAGLNWQVTRDQVKAAIGRSYYQVDLRNPGMAPQAAAALAFGTVNPFAVSDLSDEYSNYWQRTTAGYYR